MNELIEDLWNRELEYNSIPMDFIEFKQAIQAACKAQRNACKRVYADNLFDDTYTAIANAKIERQDYE